MKFRMLLLLLLVLQGCKTEEDKLRIGNPLISNETLASLTLFTASSKAEKMNTTKNLISSILNRNTT